MEKLFVLASAYACHPNPLGNIALYPGEAVVGWNLVKQLGRFHKVLVITSPRNRPGIEKATKKEKIHDVEFCYVDLPMWIRPLEWIEFGIRIYYYLWQIQAFLVARKLHRQLCFDVAHHITFNNDWMPSFIGAFLSIPFIWGPVGGGQRTPQSFFREYSLGGQISEIIRDLSQLIGRNILFSRRQCLKKAKAMLVCNYETRGKVPKKHLHKVHFFPVNGISEAELSKDSNEHKSREKFLVLTAGRLHRLKGFDIAIRAFTIFANKFQNVTLEIVGKGPEEAKLFKLTKNLPIKDKIHFTPWLPREKLLAKMRESEVFLFPSFRDGGGAVVVEAMASKIPIICLDTGGPGFHIQEEWGIKIEPRNPDYAINEMVKALERLYVDKDLRIKMGSAARKRAEEYYLWNRLGERMQEIYKEALMS